MNKVTDGEKDKDKENKLRCIVMNTKIERKRSKDRKKRITHIKENIKIVNVEKEEEGQLHKRERWKHSKEEKKDKQKRRKKTKKGIN